MNYGDAAGFVAYHEARGNVIPGTWDDTYIEAALLVASEWIDNVYGPSFIGHKTDGFLQVREWPRINATVKGTGYWGEYYVFPDNVIPDQIIYATYEGAYRQATTAGVLQRDYTPNKYKSVKVEGAIAVEYVSFSNSSETQLQINVVETLLYPFLDQSTGSRMSSYSGPVSRV